MGKIYRIRVRGKQRKHPDAALVAQAIIQLGRELWEREQQRQADEQGALSSTPPDEPPAEEAGSRV